MKAALMVDARWLAGIAEMRRPSLTFFFRALCRSFDPDVGVLVVIALALFGGLYNPIAHRLTMATLIAGIFVVIIKPSVRRTRPVFDMNAAVPPDRFSFPSGHTAAAFAIALSLLGAAPVLVVPALLIAALVGFARVYLGVHYPIDVFFGALLGTFTGLIAGLL